VNVWGRILDHIPGPFWDVSRDAGTHARDTKDIEEDLLPVTMAAVRPGSTAPAAQQPDRGVLFQNAMYFAGRGKGGKMDKRAYCQAISITNWSSGLSSVCGRHTLFPHTHSGRGILDYASVGLCVCTRADHGCSSRATVLIITLFGVASMR
jgi:hypothetical protein